ncbi:MAG: 50S ribosomal protein L24 [Deltaproteobacteria bacterium CG11_big_fil_rev_8_21_14_0_20_47_16]|nr:MAG: 50S ribosomal protein L24 [Deltaproteobacteria bacterium CG11_big_fil_rev_8_21_14_0_20_47_16]
MSKAHVKKGDTVKVLTGKEKGKSGKVIRVDAGDGVIFIEKLNMIKRHMKPSAQNRQGGIVEKESGIHWSNVVRVQESKPAK